MPPNNDSDCVESHEKSGTVKKVRFAVAFDSGDGSFADYTLTSNIDGFLLQLQSNPGVTCTADYDVSLIDEDGLDVLRTVGTDLHESNSETVPIPSGTYFHPPITPDEPLILKISGNSITNATTVLKLIYSPMSG